MGGGREDEELAEKLSDQLSFFCLFFPKRIGQKIIRRSRLALGVKGPIKIFHSDQIMFSQFMCFLWTEGLRDGDAGHSS